MKITITKPVDYDVKYIRLIVPVNEEDVPLDFPFMENGCWNVFIVLETGEILGPNYQMYPKGENLDFDVFWKIVDRGTYSLYTVGGIEVKTIQDYVPNGVIPGEYGDYIELQIDQNGFITNWPKSFDFSEFTANEDD